MKILYQPNHHCIKSLIFEDVYQREIFENLLNDISTIYKEKSEVYIKRYSFSDLLRLIPDVWPGKKYLKKKLNVTFCLFKFNDNDTDIFNYEEFSNFSSYEKVFISKCIENDNGFYISNCNDYDKNEAFIFINLSQTHINDIIIHELLHLFQESSGRSLYKMNNKKFLEMNKEDENYIKIAMNLTSKDVQYIFSKDELSNYIRELYYHIKNTLKLNKTDMKRFIVNMFMMLDNGNKQNGLTFYINSLYSISKDKVFNNLILNNDINNIGVNMLLISSYYGVGLNTIRNHLHGYLIKDEN